MVNALHTNTLDIDDQKTYGNGLRKVWDIPGKHKCPVIGSCLTPEEHEKVVRKSGIRTKGLSLYDLHQVIISHIENENLFSKRVDKMLKVKYKQVIERLVDMDERQIKLEWQQTFPSEGFDGLFFFISIREGLSADFLEDVYGEIHMMSHTVVKKVTKAERKTNLLKGTMQKFQDQLNFYKKQLRELKRENDKLLKSLEKPALILSKEGDSKLSDQRLKKDVTLIRANEKLKKENTRLIRVIDRKEKENAEMQQKLNENNALNVHLKGDIEDLISHFSMLSDYHESADNPDSRPNLFFKRVLIVGGMTKIRHLYQHLIESNGGKFEYHDGCLKHGTKKLDNQVRRSDLIIYPVNCNSHNACNEVKKLCNKYNKPFKILSKASVSSISTALFHENE